MMLDIKITGLCLALSFITGALCCSDNNSNCDYWKGQGFCATDSRYYGYMQTTCQKTCAFCQVNPCDKLPCKNAGTCSQLGSGFSCKCRTGFEGKTCETVNPCATNPCKNGGSCSRQGSKSSCICLSGYEGTTCEKVAAKVCQNSANYDKQCSVWKDAGFCSKEHKYFGFMNDHCSKTCGFCASGNPCDKKPCKNSGTCTKAGIGFTCVCTTGYSGKTCETEDCRDQSDIGFCGVYKLYCKHSQYGKTITLKCKKTCAACGGPPCGLGPDKLGRVVGGENSEPHAWRWQAKLKIDDVFKCGGTLVAKQWVLTAGHCLRNIPASSLKVVLGDHDRNKEEGTEQTFTVLKIVRNPNYNPTTKDSDVALLKLSSEAILNKYVTVACLPTAPPTELQPCYMTGWGRTVGLGETANVLQEVMLPVVSNKQCGILNTRRTITDNMLCAGNGLNFKKTQSGCQGDSGGPFVCQKGTTWSVHGVVSWGSSRCIASESYTVFVRVTQFVDWIKQTIA